MKMMPNYSLKPSYNERHKQICTICNTPEYSVALKIIQRSGLQANNWGFLIHDIASHLQGEGPYVITDDFVPDDWDGD